MRSSRSKTEQNAELVRARLGSRDALFGFGDDSPRLVQIRLDTVQANPEQPRKVFDEASIGELAASIKRHGLLQPVVVKRLAAGSGYRLVAGERRFRAVRTLGWTEVPAIITDGNEDQLALIENVQREDLKPVDQADAVARLMEKYAYTQEEVGEIIGKHRSTISELVAIHRLPADIKQACRSADAPKSVLLEVARLDDPAAQRALWARLRQGGSARSAREARLIGAARQAPSNPSKTPTGRTLLAARTLLRHLRVLPPDQLAANLDHRDELMRLKTEIDDLLARIATSAR
jgi:ParB family chromosome partitioning protein